MQGPMQKNLDKQRSSLQSVRDALQKGIESFEAGLIPTTYFYIK